VQDSVSKYWRTSGKVGIAGQNHKGNIVVREEIGKLSSIDLYQTETIPDDDMNLYKMVTVPGVVKNLYKRKQFQKTI
jgi:hypothetical protein